MTRPPRNIAASVRARLLKVHESTGDDYNLLLVRYALERFLFRLGRSAHRDSFVLKGAMLFTFWGGPRYRATRDLDLLGFGDVSVAAVEAVVRDICVAGVPDDGVLFDTDSVRGSEIRTIDEYGGVRAELVARIGTATIPIQIDVGFGDALTPPPTDIVFPTLLESPSPEIRAYARETVIAEKVEAIVKLAMLNTRYKDYFDLAFIAAHFDVDGGTLSSAMRNTFSRRQRPLPLMLPSGLSDDFSKAPGKDVQWLAFCRKSRIPEPHATLGEIVPRVREFVWPVLESVAEEMNPPRSWSPGRGWIR